MRFYIFSDMLKKSSYVNVIVSNKPQMTSVGMNRGVWTEKCSFFLGLIARIIFDMQLKFSGNVNKSFIINVSVICMRNTAVNQD